EIMKDSRLGAFGVLALVLTVLLKAGVVFALADPLKPGLAFALLVGAAGWSRALMTAIWAALPPANPGGLASVRPDMRQAAIALTLALGLLFILLLLPGTGFLLGAAVLAAVVAGLFALFARWQFGGVTGDVCGAAQVLAELAFFAAALSHITGTDPARPAPSHALPGAPTTPHSLPPLRHERHHNGSSDPLVLGPACAGHQP
ncbi:MAG: adenosylcobinamide-GDP ribazoletransferase, partial [Pseudomonadota bacterium]|nr:adenosylcobinamide-GDP ribazoletransferase [Pseudomonadota bacterium]